MNITAMKTTDASDFAKRVTLDDVLNLVENFVEASRLANERGADKTLAAHMSQARLAMIEALKITREIAGVFE